MALCSFLIHRRELEGRKLTFGVSGKLWYNALVMYGQETGSLWPHATGEAFRIKWKDEHLTMLAGMPHISWESWRILHLILANLSVSGQQDSPLTVCPCFQRDRERTGLLPVRQPDMLVASIESTQEWKSSPSQQSMGSFSQEEQHCSSFSMIDV